jgi:hypothetical protein
MRVSRRALLRLLPAGAAALVPLLGERGAHGAAMPRRLVILQWTNGVLPEYWPKRPAGEGDFVLTDTLSPLERHRRQVLVIGGLGMPYSPSGHFSLPCLLTGTRPTVPKGQAGVGNGISIDQHVAAVLARRTPTPLRSLELGALYLVRQPAFRAVSFRGPAVDQRPLDNPPEIDPYRVWRRLFGDRVGRGTGDAAAAPDIARIRDERRSVLDYVTRDLAALGRELGREDRARLTSHLESARQLEREIYALPSAGAATACAPVAPRSGIDVHDNRGIDQMVRVQLDLLLLALRCDLTRVATVMMVNCSNDGVGFPFLGPEFVGDIDPESAFDHHGIAHQGGPKKARIDRWWIEQLALFLDRLAGTPEGEGTMLDNTLVLFANHMGNGALHDVAGIPWIIAGSAQGYFKTGRYLVPRGWDPANPASGCPPTNGVLVGIANAMLAGLEPPLSSFGLSEYGGELAGLRG